MQCVNFVILLATITLTNFIKDSEANTIVNQHNDYRKEIANGRVAGQPKSSNMKRLIWDDKLAKEAQKIADTRKFAHVKVYDSRFAVGQNLYWSGSTDKNNIADWKAAIKAWWDEHTTYRFGATTYNHYTQVVWANTKFIGCGYKYYSKRPGWYEKLYVCNYGPAGNYVGEKPYRTGKGCENLC